MYTEESERNRGEGIENGKNNNGPSRGVGVGVGAGAGGDQQHRGQGGTNIVADQFLTLLKKHMWARKCSGQFFLFRRQPKQNESTLELTAIIEIIYKIIIY